MIQKPSPSFKNKRLLKSFPVVMITGPRQCGKTTLDRVVTTNWRYFDLENPNHFDRIPGLGLFLQNIHTLEELDHFSKLGNYFEAFIVEELIRGFEPSKIRNLKFHHFRTKSGGEIDLVVSGSFGLVPIEIKYASNVRAKQLVALKNFIDVHNLPLGIVISNTDEPSLISNKIIQNPACCI